MLMGFSGDKAPEFDEFSMAFWQFSCDFVKDEMMSFIKDFHEHDNFVKSLNATFLVFIPKKGGAKDLRYFRLISLMGGLYKWLAKVLANKLKKVEGKVVTKAQGAFVEGRQILDAVLIANEAIDLILENNEYDILCTLDVEKAYGRMDWSILVIMQKMGFGDKWVVWIQWCISTTSFSVLVNDIPLGFFSKTQGF